MSWIVSKKEEAREANPILVKAIGEKCGREWPVKDFSFAPEMFLSSFMALDEILRLAGVFLAADRESLGASKYGSPAYLVKRIRWAEEALTLNRFTRSQYFRGDFAGLVRSRKSTGQKGEILAFVAEKILGVLRRAGPKWQAEISKKGGRQLAARMRDIEGGIRRTMAVLTSSDSRPITVGAFLTHDERGHVFLDGLCLRCAHSKDAIDAFHWGCNPQAGEERA